MRSIGGKLDVDAARAVERLLAVRNELRDGWSTLDLQTASTFVDLFGEAGGRGKTFLEIGSGYGLTCVLLAMLGAAEVHGIELIPSAVASAEKVATRVDPHLPVFFRQGDVSQGLPYADARFDVVLMIEVLSHVVVADLKGFLREAIRVLKPGGRMVISDGNNARSWKRRRENRRLWERFDQGPPTLPDEAVYSHKIATPYVALRRQIAQRVVPSLLPEEVDTIAARTFGFSASEVEEAARHYRESGEWPASPFRRGVCPIEPNHRMYIEQLIDPLAVRRHLREAGCDDVVCGPRRALPLRRLWTAVPRAVFLVSNGFKIIARRR